MMKAVRTAATAAAAVLVCSARADNPLEPESSHPRPWAGAGEDAVSDNGRFALRFKETQPFADDRSCFDQLDEPVVVQVAARQDDGTWAEAPKVEFDVSRLLDVEWQPRDWDGPFPVASNDEYGLSCGAPRLFIDNTGETVAMALPDVGAVLTATRRNTTSWLQLDLLRESDGFVLENHPTKLGEAKGKVVGGLFGQVVDFYAGEAVLAVSATAALGAAGKVHVFHLTVDEEWERWDVLTHETDDPGKPDGFGQVLAVVPGHRVVIASDEHILMVSLNATDGGVEADRLHATVGGATRISLSNARGWYDDMVILDVSSSRGGTGQYVVDSGLWLERDWNINMFSTTAFVASSGSLIVYERDGKLEMQSLGTQSARFGFVLPSGPAEWSPASRVSYYDEKAASVWAEDGIYTFRFPYDRPQGPDLGDVTFAAAFVAGATVFLPFAILCGCYGSKRSRRASAVSWGIGFTALVALHFMVLATIGVLRSDAVAPIASVELTVDGWAELLVPYTICVVLGMLVLGPTMGVLMCAAEWAKPNRKQVLLALFGTSMWAGVAITSGLMIPRADARVRADPFALSIDGESFVLTILPGINIVTTAVATVLVPCFFMVLQRRGSEVEKLPA